MIQKREIFCSCFDNFDYDKIAAYDEADINRIMNIEGMLRSRRKIEAVINNARCFQKIRCELPVESSTKQDMEVTQKTSKT